MVQIHVRVESVNATLPPNYIILGACVNNVKVGDFNLFDSLNNGLLTLFFFRLDRLVLYAPDGC